MTKIRLMARVSKIYGILLMASIFSYSVYAKPATQKEVEKKTLTVAIVNVLKGQEKTWVVHPPEVPAGHPLKITVVNTMDEPHGLAVNGMIPETVIVPNEVRTFEIPADKTVKGAKKIRCHMHPAHVGTEIKLK